MRCDLLLLLLLSANSGDVMKDGDGEAREAVGQAADDKN